MADEDVVEPENPETVIVPGAFAARQARLDAIAASAEEERVKGGEFGDEPSDEPVVSEEAGGDETTEEPAEPIEAPEPLRKVKVRINGEDRELTQEELVATAQKVLSADQYLEKAKETFKVATQVRPSAPDVEPQGPTDDDRALARALQMGDEEEAAKAIHRLRPRPSSPDTVAIIDSRLALRQQLSTVEAEYKDLLGHKALGPIFRQRISELAQANPNLQVIDGYAQVATSLREDFGALLKPVTTPKLERKAAAPQVPAAGARQKSQPDEDAEEPVGQEVQRIAEANHRRYYGK